MYNIWGSGLDLPTFTPCITYRQAGFQQDRVFATGSADDTGYLPTYPPTPPASPWTHPRNTGPPPTHRVCSSVSIVAYGQRRGCVHRRQRTACRAKPRPVVSTSFRVTVCHPSIVSSLAATGVRQQYRQHIRQQDRLTANNIANTSANNTGYSPTHPPTRSVIRQHLLSRHRVSANASASTTGQSANTSL